MKKMYNLNDIGANLVLPCREAPGPRGISLEYIWNLSAADQMIALIVQDNINEVILDGHPQAWLACYLALKLRPRVVSLFIPPMGCDIPMVPLSFGQVNPNGHIIFQVSPFEDGLLLQFQPDSPDYQPSFLQSIVLPESTKGQHIYLQGMAPNFITGSLALTLADVCPSVSIGGQDGSFICVSSTSGNKQLGQITAQRPMERPNAPASERR